MPDKDPALARFAAALARLRESAGWTRFALAKAARPLDEIGLSRMERGERSPRLETLCRLADVLGCTMDELCGRMTSEGGGDGDSLSEPRG